MPVAPATANRVEPGSHLRPHPVARQLLNLPQRRAGAGQAADAYRDRPRVRCLPHHPHLGRRGIHSPGRHRQLRRMPQRCRSDRHAGEPHSGRHDAVRGLPFADELRELRGHQDQSPGSHRLSCASCHETAAFLGMKPSPTPWPRTRDPRDARQEPPGDRRLRPVPRHHHLRQQRAATGKPHPDQRPVHAVPHDPGNYALYSVTGVHQGVTACLSCHAPNVGPFANVTGHHPRQPHPDRQPRLQRLGLPHHHERQCGRLQARLGQHHRPDPHRPANSVAAAVAACQSCHESAGYLGMLASTATGGDSRPTALDKTHPTTGDCSGCHTTTPTFASDVSSAGKPANHIPTTAPCTQCHTTAATRSTR